MGSGAGLSRFARNRAGVVHDKRAHGDSTASGGTFGVAYPALAPAEAAASEV